MRAGKCHLYEAVAPAAMVTKDWLQNSAWKRQKASLHRDRGAKRKHGWDTKTNGSHTRTVFRYSLVRHVQKDLTSLAFKKIRTSSYTGIINGACQKAKQLTAASPWQHKQLVDSGSAGRAC